MSDMREWQTEALKEFLLARLYVAMNGCMEEPHMREAVTMRYLGRPTTRLAISEAIGASLSMTGSREERALQELARWLGRERDDAGHWGTLACALAWYAEIATDAHVEATGDVSTGRLYARDPLAAMAMDVLGRAGFPARATEGRVSCRLDGWPAMKAGVARLAGTWAGDLRD